MIYALQHFAMSGYCEGEIELEPYSRDCFSLSEEKAANTSATPPFALLNTTSISNDNDHRPATEDQRIQDVGVHPRSHSLEMVSVQVHHQPCYDGGRMVVWALIYRLHLTLSTNTLTLHQGQSPYSEAPRGVRCGLW